MSLLPSTGEGPPAVVPVQPETLADSPLSAIVRLVTSGSWFDFACVRAAFVQRHVERRMRQHLDGSMSEYLALLRRDPTELEALRADILASGRWFFRDARVWDFVAQQVIPAIMAHPDRSRPIRVWVPFCGRGAEAYTVAMLIHEQASRVGRRVQLFASDEDDRSLDLARAGSFPSIVSVIGAARLRRFFIASKHGYRVSKALRESVVFARHDLFSDPPFSHIDLVCCRYVFMHLRPTARLIATRVLAQALDDDGYLILAPVETLTDAAGRFENVSRPCAVFRRIARSGRTAMAQPSPSTVGRAAEALPSTALHRPPSPGDLAASEDGRLAQVLRLVTMGNLSASLAHELSQPLGAIANLLAACASRARGGAPTSELLDLLRQASAQSQRAGSLVAHVTRLLHGGERRVERCDLRDLLMAGVQLLRPTLRRHGIALRLVLGKLPLEGDVCRIEIEQVGVNLLQNAVDAILLHPGHRGRIRMEASTSGRHATIIVADSGRGVCAEAGDRIFEPFFTTKASGLGMGLAICRAIVTAHGGRLWTERTADATLMCFTLPLAAPEARMASVT